VKVSDFSFELPPELVAQFPAAERGGSRLLVLDRARGALTHATIGDLTQWLRPGDLLVLNDTRVFPARLLGVREPGGGAVEVLLVSRIDDQRWEALVHPVLAQRFFGRREVRLWTDEACSVTDAIEAIGHIPLPPYIRRADLDVDRDRYQTVFAREQGSIAAPTAGLHFTDLLLERIAAAGVERTEITLHVGYGTFKPVRVDEVESHTVDSEHYAIGSDAAARITAALAEGRRIVAVGTTTTRAVEAAAIRGQGRVDPGAGETDLFIYPGYRFRAVGALLTNFHLPASSLLMLVAAFGGREAVLGAYGEAVREGYRFYSYGDAMLIV
jgi:S-adenosylmethionine:tRNA ribosyltransferase-isomerase